MGVAETSIASKREAWAARRKSVTPKTLSLAEQDLVSTSFLPDGGPLPLVVQPNFDGVNLTGWAANNVEFIESNKLRLVSIEPKHRFTHRAFNHPY